MNGMKEWKQRYRDLGNLFWVVIVILTLCWCLSAKWSAGR